MLGVGSWEMNAEWENPEPVDLHGDGDEGSFQ